MVGTYYGVDENDLLVTMTHTMRRKERKAVAHWWRNRGMDRGWLPDGRACGEFVALVVAEAIGQAEKI